MKNSLLLISATLLAGACTSTEPSEPGSTESQLRIEDSIKIVKADTDTVNTLDPPSTDTLNEETMTPELRAAYAKVLGKMKSQEPVVHTLGDSFKYNLTPEEWEVYNRFHRIKAKANMK